MTFSMCFKCVLILMFSLEVVCCLSNNNITGDLESTQKAPRKVSRTIFLSGKCCMYRPLNHLNYRKLCLNVRVKATEDQGVFERGAGIWLDVDNTESGGRKKDGSPPVESRGEYLVGSLPCSIWSISEKCTTWYLRLCTQYFIVLLFLFV